MPRLYKDHPLDTSLQVAIPHHERQGPEAKDTSVLLGNLLNGRMRSSSDDETILPMGKSISTMYALIYGKHAWGLEDTTMEAKATGSIGT